LGCFGDGGAIFTNDDDLAYKIRMIANHGQSKKYHHDIVGCNSRLDTLQAAILNIKIGYLNHYIQARQECADRYDKAFKNIKALKIPSRQHNCTHTFHQYTLQVEGDKRDALKADLESKGIPSMIYYPIPLHKQQAFRPIVFKEFIPTTEHLCKSVLSLPIHTEMRAEDQSYIIDGVLSFFK
jgi:dTDP-4-amino-4,6-dideoxygalactose transaminase